jgi:hypothetical protein
VQPGAVQRDDSARRLYALPLALIFVALPFFVAEYLPSTDLPQHLAQIRMLEELWGLRPPTMDLSNLTVRPFGGNTLVYWPLFMLSRMLPPLWAGKVLLLGLSLANVCALHFLARLRGRDPLHVIACGMLLFDLSLYWGLLNFLSGLPLFLWLVPLALRRGEAWGLRTFAACTALIAALFWAHVFWLPWAAVLLLIGQMQEPRNMRGYGLRALSLLPGVLCAAAWYPTLVKARTDAGFMVGAYYHIPVIERFSFKWLSKNLFGGGQGLFEEAFIVVVLIYAGFACWSGRRAGRAAYDLCLLTLGLSFIAFALFAPDQYMNTILFNRRYLSIGVIVLLLSLPAIEAVLAARVLCVAAAVFAIKTALFWSLFDQEELAGLRQALALGRAKSSILGLSFRPVPSYIGGNPFLQTFAYFQVQHGGELNFSFAEHASSIVAYARPRQRSWTPELELWPERVRRRDIAAFDCTLVNAEPADHARFAAHFNISTPQREGYFRLYCRR